ncbi:MAG: hypothetical protein HDS70_07725 [Bacteroidales bacterium]|nr:hypothetical protein [Bacteroidales bacterium]MBD5222234.1 hypothetical protein [Bacteroidales bacterium]
MEKNIPKDVPVMAVVITKTKADGMLTYDAVRRAWKLSEGQLEKANKAKYVLAIEDSTVVDIFERHGEFYKDESEEDRYSFLPVPVRGAGIRSRYIGTRYRSCGQAVIFLGFENV